MGGGRLEGETHPASREDIYVAITWGAVVGGWGGWETGGEREVEEKRCSCV